jgi:hypothetical protein
MASQRSDLNDAITIADNWLSLFSRALHKGAVDDLVATFQPDGWLKDSLVFSWTSRSLHGRALIRDYLASAAQTILPEAHISNIQLDRTTKGLAPAFIPLGGKVGGTGVRFAFTFEAPAFYAKAFVLLRKHETERDWKAILVFMRMEEIKGNPPSAPESGVYEGHTLAWEEVWDERRSKIEADPYVIIGMLNIDVVFPILNRHHSRRWSDRTQRGCETQEHEHTYACYRQTSSCGRSVAK